MAPGRSPMSFKHLLEDNVVRHPRLHARQDPLVIPDAINARQEVFASFPGLSALQLAQCDPLVNFSAFSALGKVTSARTLVAKIAKVDLRVSYRNSLESYDAIRWVLDAAVTRAALGKPFRQVSLDTSPDFFCKVSLVPHRWMVQALHRQCIKGCRLTDWVARADCLFTDEEIEAIE